MKALTVALFVAAFVALLGVAALVFWLVYVIFGLWFMLFDLAVSAPLAWWSQVRAMRAKGLPMPWEPQRRREADDFR